MCSSTPGGSLPGEFVIALGRQVLSIQYLGEGGDFVPDRSVEVSASGLLGEGGWITGSPSISSKVDPSDVGGDSSCLTRCITDLDE
jgi:hypothetical protein